MKQWVFLSYDLGFQGNYSELYKWLDTHKAQECGDSYCRFIYEFKSIAVRTDVGCENVLVPESAKLSP